MRHAPPGKRQRLPTHGVPEYQHWLKHKNIYGGVSSVSVLGMTLIIVHDKQAAHDLLGQAMRYTREFLRNRKSSHQDLGTKVLAAEFIRG
jgi:hypothetical protein